jgi:hypothetical protein
MTGTLVTTGRASLVRAKQDRLKTIHATACDGKSPKAISRVAIFSEIKARQRSRRRKTALTKHTIVGGLIAYVSLDVAKLDSNALRESLQTITLEPLSNDVRVR